MTQIPKTTETLLLVEVRGKTFFRLGSQQGMNIDKPMFDIAGQLKLEGLSPLHDPYWNYLLADGHVEKLRPEDTLRKNAGNPIKYTYLWTRNPND